MKRLSKYRKSKVLDINITYNGERVSFNLGTELKIKPEGINDELMTQAGYYGFCLLMHKKLLAIFEQKKLERKSTFGRLFLRAKETKTMNGRPYSDDAAKCWVESHKKFISLTEECIKSREAADIMQSAVKSFEQRKDLLQSISSNVRAEK